MTIQSFLLDLAIGPVYGVKPPTPMTVQSFIEQRAETRSQWNLYARYNYMRNFVGSFAPSLEFGPDAATATMKSECVC
ncbi:hypothetical protein SCLCIDRAFT_1214385 [Scleroderma citrinum Foug A]|uniref:Uncharacterized protein n=1 Tax=Scleroderma citrinum Foug A TaxID=1036808 RepID=A0A0C3E5J2_9AGAM|nr:hypothetical protein SCLCIDRAFT_1214385 [Scleroderma citrinum Foug A]